MSALSRLTARPVLAGTAPAELPKPAEPAKPQIVKPAPETCKVFSMKSITWKDAAGPQQYGQIYDYHRVTPEAALRGLRCGALIPIDDPRCKKLVGTHAGYHIGKHTAIDLDDEQACRPSHIEPITRSEANFTPLDRGPERILKVTP